jgi:hypothetical protein
MGQTSLRPGVALAWYIRSLTATRNQRALLETANRVGDEDRKRHAQRLGEDHMLDARRR